MGGCKNVFVQSAVILVILGVLAVNGYENDDIVFDQDGRNPAIEVPLFEKQGGSSLFQRVKRGIFDWWKSSESENSTTEQPAELDTTPSSNDDQSSSPASLLNTLPDEAKSRKSRESGEDNAVEHDDPKNEHDNDIGQFAAGHYPLPDYRQTDDEDLGGSGDVEGSANEDDLFNHGTEPSRPSGPARFYRITLTVSEPYIKEYADRNSHEYQDLSKSLSKGITDLYKKSIPDYEHLANVVKVSPLDVDPFTSQVTIDVGSTFGDEEELRNILEQQLQYHSLGGFQVSPDGFTFRNFQATGEPECNEHTELRCRDGSCIPLSFRCDNITQCADNSDELDCPPWQEPDESESRGEHVPDDYEEEIDDYDPVKNKIEPSSHDKRLLVPDNEPLVPVERQKCRGDDSPTLCTDGSRRICTDQYCDGIKDCDDGADEEGCPPLGCAEGEFACDVSRCILDSQRCDFHEDCEDGSDEATCIYPTCVSSEFKCRNGQCIASHLRCNGVTDCKDSSDEMSCPCKDGEFECTPLYCIAKMQRCDGINDCSNGRDEQDCDSNPQCRPDEFECLDHTCIPQLSRCDGRSDCRDRSDERNCNVTTCTRDQFRCQDGTCLALNRRCDGHNDCRNGEDEVQCGCLPSEFVCNDGQCVASQKQCNGVYDCTDGSDERDCATIEKNTPRYDLNDKEFHSRVGKITTRRTTTPKISHGRDRRVDEPRHTTGNFMSAALDIPWAGSVDDAEIAAFPELGWIPKKAKEMSNENSPDNQWEYASKPDDREKIGKMPKELDEHFGKYKQKNIVTTETTPKNESNDLELLFAGNKSVKDLIDYLPSEDEYEGSTEYYYDGEVEETPIIETPAPDENKSDNKIFKTNTTVKSTNRLLEKVEHSTENLWTKYLVPGHTTEATTFNQVIDPYKGITTSAKKLNRPSKDLRGSNDQNIANGTIILASSSTENNTIDIITTESTTPLNAKPKKNIFSYFDRYKVTKSTTLEPVTSLEKKVNRDINISPNATIDEKSQRHSQKLRESNGTDIVDVILKSISSTTEKSNESITETIRFSKLNSYMKKYNVTKMMMNVTTPAFDDVDTEIPPVVTDPKGQVEIFSKLNISNASNNNGTSYRFNGNLLEKHPDDMANKILERMGSIEVNRLRNQISDEDRNHSKHKKGRLDKNKMTNGKNRQDKNNRKRKDWSHQKNSTTTKKPDPYDRIKVESESFHKNKVKLPIRPEFDVLVGITSTETSHRDHDDEKCKVVCEKCLKNKSVELINSTGTITKSKLNIDSGLYESGEEVSLPKSKIDLETDGSREVETVEEIATTTKKPQRRNGNKPSKAPEPKTRKKTQKGSSKNKDADQHTEKPNKKNGRNGNGKKGRKTTHGVRKTTDVFNNTTIAVQRNETTKGIEVTTQNLPRFSVNIVEPTLTGSSESTTTRGTQSMPSELSTKATEAIEPTENQERQSTVQLESTTKYCGWWGLLCDDSESSDGEKDTMSKTEEKAETPTATTAEACTSPNCEDKESSDQNKTKSFQSSESTDLPKTEETKDTVTPTMKKKPVTVLGTTAEDSKSESHEFSGATEKNTEIEEGSGSWDTGNEIDMESVISEEVIPINRKKVHSKDNPTIATWTDIPRTSTSWHKRMNVHNPEQSSTQHPFSSTPTTPRLEFATRTWPRTRCRSDEHSCDDHTNCINREKICDKINDCNDGSDERYCLYRNWRNYSSNHCGNDQYFCDHRKCITIDKVCDNIYDCDDGSDEANCVHRNRKDFSFNRCRDDQYLCDGTLCLEQEKLCDNFADCRDGTDEKDCDYYFDIENTVIRRYFGKNHKGKVTQISECLPELEFACNDGTCIPDAYECDSIRDCPDGEDEDLRLCQDRQCTPTQFKCVSSGKCIEGVYKCDGHPDCEDRSDENCHGSSNDTVTHTVTHTNSPPSRHWITERPDGRRECDPRTEMRCDDGQCIQLRRKCDNIFDCLDNSDERGCGFCQINEWKCGSGDCVTENARCDGQIHCPDGSDEIGCVTECPPGSFRCNDGLCLDSKRRCDGRPHCRDGSDEINCQSPYCLQGKKPCANGVCIDESFFCDNNQDCLDGSDEKDCPDTVPPYPQGCPHDYFTCHDGACIHLNAFCDGRSDCPDDSDELNCKRGIDASDKTSSGRHSESVQVFTDSSGALGGPYGITVTETDPWSNQTTTRSCTTTDFVCADGTCIPAAHRCDNFYDCRDFTDEQYCFECSGDQFQCRNGDCVSRSQRCDGIIHCDDGSDEDGCATEPPPSYGCSSDQFTCVYDRNCVHHSSRCNGIPECRDRSDEEGCATGGDREGLNLKTYPSEQIIKENPAKQGREVVFQCRDEGQLRAKVRWVRGNGLPLPPGSRDLNGRLEIPNIQLEHAGTYICEAVGYPSSTPGQQLSVHLEVEKFELPATRPPHVCKYDEATCSNGDCIPKSWVCNGKFDCTDGSDEMRCNPHGCEPNQFRCANKQCISKIWRCDADKDCADGSDEENCEAPPQGSNCKAGYYKCATVDQCIPRSYQCDMERDCQDGSDEIGCSQVYITKPPPPMMNLHPGDTMVLTCTAIGVPVPEINWRLNWGHVPAKCYSTSINGTGVLTCPDIQIADQGAYSCEAMNNAGFVFAVPDTILIVNQTDDVCPVGKFNSEARTPEECIPCFCFGVTDKCKSANLFTYEIPPPFDRYRAVTVDTNADLKIRGEINSLVAEVRPRGSNGVELSAPRNNELTSYNVPYFELPKTAYGSSRLRSYGGYLRYTIIYSGDGVPNYAPDVILTGNNYVLLHRGGNISPDVKTERSVRFFFGEWLKYERGAEIMATRAEIMMVLANIESILIKAKYENSPELQVSITNIGMDTAGSTGVVPASYVEECSCPTGYTGESCENCATGYLRRTTGLWLGECYSEPKTCQPGYYGDPLRNIPCRPCPCPLTNPSNQFARTCRLGSTGNPICDCPPGYTGERCEMCAHGYHGNPLIDKCVRDEFCDPHGSLTPNPDSTGKCRCKQYTTGLKCDQCKANTFNLAAKNQFGCISCFCMGITNRCISSNWYRNEIRVSFTNSIRDFTLVDSNIPNAQPIAEGITLDYVNREIVYNAFPNRGNTDVYYWQLPNIFRGNQIGSYGGNLRYTVRYVPTPGGQSSRNNAADVELISANDIKLLYYSRETPEPNTPQSFTVPLLEQYWQRTDGTQADREHLLMALADVEEFMIKATYTTHTSEAALSLVSLDTAEKYNTGKERAVEVEECSCPAGYRGLSCEDCAVGYTRAMEGLYLGICEPCNCNGHSTQCDPETGICENCGNHTTGENCDVCEPGYEGDPTRGGCTRGTSQPQPCNCDPAGSEDDRCVGDRCVCKANVEGRDCNRCRPSTFGLSAENRNGCNTCWCSGVTNQCHESSLYIQQIPIAVYDSHHGFTLTDALSTDDFIDDGFDVNVALNEIGYRYPNDRNRNRRLFWSLPSTFTGNKVKSYGGKLTLTQHINAAPNAKALQDQDVLLVGNGIRLYWTNPQEIVPGTPLTYTVPLRESEWRRLSTDGPRQATRNDMMTVLSNLESIFVRASHSEEMIATYISDISLDTAVENIGGSRRATQIEACRCPPGYSGTSCETCARGYYRDTGDRRVNILGSCNLCPCTGHEESCEISRNGQIKCHCLPGYTGSFCEEIAELRVGLMPMKPQAPRYSLVKFTCSYEHSDKLYIYFKMTPYHGLPLTAWALAPESIVVNYNGAHRDWNVHVGDYPCNVECYIIDRHGKELAKISTTISPDDGPHTPPPLPPTPSPPRIIISIQEKKIQIVQTGSTVKYHCSGRSLDDAPLRIRWEKEGSPMPESSLDDSRGVLVLRDVRVSDSGIYVCHVTDGFEVVRDKVTLTVGAWGPVQPQVKIYPSHHQVYEGEPVQFRCEGSGNPTPELDWVRVSGRMNPEATFINGVWSLPVATKADAAEYKCIARNNIGTDERTTILYVLSRPEPPGPPGNYTGPPKVSPTYWAGSAGDPVRLICARADTHARVIWVRSGSQPLPYSGSQRNGVLTIGDPIPTDSGVYICTATSWEGAEVSTSANVTIYPKTGPKTHVTVEPERQTVSQGTSAEVRCITDRNSGLRIKWVKYGEPSLGPNVQQIGDTLKITNPQVSDRGVYICQASNAAGNWEATATIEVERREVPILEIHPKDSQTVILGGSATIQCRILAGYPIPEVHWQRDDGHGFGSNIQSMPGGVLRLTNVTVNDGGAYRCSASNTAGSTSAVARIEVQSLPVITVTPGGGLIYVKERQPVRLMCSASGLPQPSVTWKRSQPGINIYNFLRTSDAQPHTAVHEITSMSPDDEGSYECQAINAAGITEERVEIRIDDGGNDVDSVGPCRGDRDCQEGGGDITPNDSIKIPTGGRAEIRCRILGPTDPRIYVDWKRANRRPLPDRSVVRDDTLEINDVTKEAAGEYVCIGRDRHGSEVFQAKYILEVVSPPEIKLNPNRQTVGPGESPAISCTATGDQPLRIEWEAIGRPLPHSVTNDRGVLQFHGITFADAGKYICKATNDAGTAEAVAEVVVSDSPYHVAGIHAPERDVTTFAGNSIRLRCDAGRRSKIDWTKYGGQIPSNAYIGEDYIEIVRVRPEDSGKYICQTSDDRGVSSDYVNLRVEVYTLADCMRLFQTMQCGYGRYQCGSRECISLDNICDGSINCNDGTDERFCRNPRYRLYLQRRREAVNSAVTIEPSQDVVNIGDMIDLRCTYTGTQMPRYRWTRPHHSSLPSNAIEHGATLRIMDIGLSESGLYRCHADTPEGSYDEDYNLIVQGGTNDAPAIDTKSVPYGSSLEMGCRMDLEPPVKFSWSKLGGLLPRDIKAFDNKLKLTNVKADDAGTYICTATNGVESSEVPTVLVVTGVVPYFNQAPQSWIALPPLPGSYLKFNIEVSFKPEIYDGLIMYNDETAGGTGDFISLSLVNGYPEFSFDLGSGAAVIKADKPVSLGEWHTIKVQRNRKEGTMFVDEHGPYSTTNPGRKQGLDLKEPLYIGGVSDFNSINPKANVNAGFVGCISRLVLGEEVIDLIGNQTDSVGVTTCETCAENPCNNGGACQEASTTTGYRCLCRAGYSGRHCDSTGQSCYPGACGEGNCFDNENGLTCYCPPGRTGSRCEYRTGNLTDPSFRDDRAFLAYSTPPASRRLKLSMKFKPSDNGDGILMYISRSDKGLGDFAAVVIKDRSVEFRYDVGSGMAVARSNYVIQPGLWTHVTVSREYKDGRISVNGEPTVSTRSTGTSRTLTVRTPLYIGGIDRRRITVNRNIGVDRNFHGCIKELEVSSMNLDILSSVIDSANIEDCSNSPTLITESRRNPGTTQQPTRPPTTFYDPCETKPCVNGACQSISVSDYSCTCEYGYVGRNCEKVLKQCELLRPCQNGGSCTDLHGSYKCDCRLGSSGKDCEKKVEITNDVAFRGDGWLELERSIMRHEEEHELIGFEISTNKTNGLIMWHGQTPNDLSADDYIALAVVDGYVEFQYNLGSGPAVIRIDAQRVDDGGRHRIILKRHRSEGSIELNGEYMERGISGGLQQILNVRGSIYLGGVPDWHMTYGRYRDGFSGCIYTMEVQDSGGIDIGSKAIRGKNVSPCTSIYENEDYDQWTPIDPPERGDVGRRS